jgi:glyoxylase-like metal-dependent hydrolase (beta-lactamase superfamily II)
MRKDTVAPGIVRYSFDPLPERHFSNSVYAVVSGAKVLLIDAGWEHEGALIAKDLKRCGLGLEAVIISHFHDDHGRAQGTAESGSLRKRSE